MTEMNRLIAHYRFNYPENIGKDSSIFGNHAIAEGSKKPIIESVGGRTALSLSGGEHGSSYMKLPAGFLKDINDLTGISVSTWVYLRKGTNVWERLFDFCENSSGPYLFLS
jgi:hypothetical protein